MIVFSAFSTALALLYFFIILRLQRALRSFSNTLRPKPATLKISVVIPFRNELAQLPALLKDMEAQDYPAHLWDIILVDDHSEDNGGAVVTDYCRNSSSQIKLLQLPAGKSGKKAALRAGIETASAEIIVQTDADCKVGPQWLSSLMGEMEHARADILLGPVKMVPSWKFWSKFAALDFMALQAVGGGMAILKKPIMGSAANLVYRKSIYQNINAGEKRASGDDVFLIQQSRKASTAISLSSAAMVQTDAPAGFRQLVEQRARWGGKATSYEVLEAQALSLLVAALSLCQVLLLLLALINSTALISWGVVMILKATADFFILKEFARQTGQETLLKSFLPATLIYPFYILITGVAILWLPVRWKGRSLRPLSD